MDYLILASAIFILCLSMYLLAITRNRYRTFESVVEELVNGLRDGSIVLDHSPEDEKEVRFNLPRVRLYQDGED